MKLMFSTFLVLFGISVHAQKTSPKANIQRTPVEYKGVSKTGRILTVQSVIPMPINDVWAKTKTPALLQFVAKGMIRFKPTDGGFPPQWQVDSTYSTKMRLFGFLPFGGKHYLLITKVDDENKIISTHEWDRRAKVWNHDITLRDLGDGTTFYTDSIIIYGGALTGAITRFAKKFYIHRQKRWQKVAKGEFVALRDVGTVENASF